MIMHAVKLTSTPRFNVEQADLYPPPSTLGPPLRPLQLLDLHVLHKHRWEMFILDVCLRILVFQKLKSTPPRPFFCGRNLDLISACKLDSISASSNGLFFQRLAPDKNPTNPNIFQKCPNVHKIVLSINLRSPPPPRKESQILN